MRHICCTVVLVVSLPLDQLSAQDTLRRLTIVMNDAKGMRRAFARGRAVDPPIRLASRRLAPAGGRSDGSAHF